MLATNRCILGLSFFKDDTFVKTTDWLPIRMDIALWRISKTRRPLVHSELAFALDRSSFRGKGESVVFIVKLNAARRCVRGFSQKIIQLGMLSMWFTDSKDRGPFQQVIQTFDAPLDLATFRDQYVEGLQKVIEAKIAGREVVAPWVPDLPPAGNVMDALRKSLDAMSQGKKKPVKVTAARPGAKRTRKAS
jgi:hypothetical protein